MLWLDGDTLICYLTSFLLRTCILSHMLPGSVSGRQAGRQAFGQVGRRVGMSNSTGLLPSFPHYSFLSAVSSSPSSQGWSFSPNNDDSWYFCHQLQLPPWHHLLAQLKITFSPAATDLHVTSFYLFVNGEMQELFVVLMSVCILCYIWLHQCTVFMPEYQGARRKQPSLLLSTSAVVHLYNNPSKSGVHPRSILL